MQQLTVATPASEPIVPAKNGGILPIPNTPSLDSGPGLDGNDFAGEMVTAAFGQTFTHGQGANSIPIPVVNVAQPQSEVGYTALPNTVLYNNGPNPFHSFYYNGHVNSPQIQMQANSNFDPLAAGSSLVPSSSQAPLSNGSASIIDPYGNGPPNVLWQFNHGTHHPLNYGQSSQTPASEMNQLVASNGLFLLPNEWPEMFPQ